MEKSFGQESNVIVSDMLLYPKSTLAHTIHVQEKNINAAVITQCCTFHAGNGAVDMIH